MTTLSYRRPNRLARFVRDTGSVIRRWWWIARGERQRIIGERDQYKAAAEMHFKQMVEYRDAIYELKVEHRGASVDLLRQIADQIDCEPGCEHVSPMDWTTGVSECHLSDCGECPFDQACQLRSLAAALETYAASVGTHPEGQDGEAGLVRSMGDAVGEAETPNPSPITPNGA